MMQTCLLSSLLILLCPNLWPLETTPAPAAIVPEVVALDSRNPPEPAEMDLGSAVDDAASSSERTAAAGTSADPVSVSMNPAPAVRKILGRRAPALLTEPINFLSRVRTSPVLVTSRPRSTDVTTSSADARHRYFFNFEKKAYACQGEKRS